MGSWRATIFFRYFTAKPDFLNTDAAEGWFDLVLADPPSGEKKPGGWLQPLAQELLEDTNLPPEAPVPKAARKKGH